VNGRVLGFDRDETVNERGSDGDILSAQAGGDLRLWSDTVLGLIFSYDRTDSDFDSDAPGLNFSPASDEGSIESDSYTLTLYGSYDVPLEGLDGLYVDATVGGGIADYEFERDVVFQESGRTVPQTDVRTLGKADGWSFSAGGTLGYDLRVGSLSVGPYARTEFVHTEVDRYSERDRSGSGLAMSVDEQERRSWVSVLGVRGSWAVSTPFGVIVPQARAEWEHEFERRPQDATPSYLLDTASVPFSIEGENPDRDYFNLGGALMLVLPNGWIPYVDYEGLVDYDDLDRYSFSFGVRKEL
jgi:outer membrane autotransporter protein